MMVYPEVQAKAHEELDRVVWRERLPTFSDEQQLPYVSAICAELLRWRPVGPLGVAHRCMEDDVYQGMMIPKGTIILPNVW